MLLLKLPSGEYINVLQIVCVTSHNVHAGKCQITLAGGHTFELNKTKEELMELLPKEILVLEL